MTALPPPTKVRLHRNTRRLMLRRRMWRRRALLAALQLATWPTAKPGREEVETEVIRAINKLHQWFREPRAQLVIRAVERRAVGALRNQFQSTT